MAPAASNGRPDPTRDPVVVSAARTPIGKFMGGLSSLRAPELGAVVIREALARAGVAPEDVEEVVMGNVIQAGVGQAPARQAALKAGIPPAVSAYTVNKVCGSGLKAVMLAAQAIRAGDLQVAVAGGMESMSNAPYLLQKAREGLKFGDAELKDSMILDGLWCGFGGVHMGRYAELTAARSGITREELDAFAYDSHRKAVAAIEAGRFDAEIVPVEVPGGKDGRRTIARDEGPRSDTDVAKLAKLRPAFQADGGVVTAGNASGINDGAAALVVMSAAAAAERGLEPLGRIRAYTTGGTDPELLFYAPVIAVRELLRKGDLEIGDFDLIEVNEAFASQALADGRELGWDWEKVNVNGGAVALGHPIGASGARVLVTLLYEMRERKAGLGLATLCLGGGNAVAMAVEAA
ncbi:MAG: acetyl-CoA C-acetyltransferase [Gemmatimonadetes bacterium]|nr:acetyl-CoA C-acetyltransferase [Gemmatimonadota bacterium]